MATALTVLPIIFTPAAQAEILEARDWYTGRGPELAARSTAEIEGIVERIAAAPQQFSIVFRDVRRAHCRRFPYALFFRIVDRTVYIIACFHGSRDPRQWQRRT